MQQMNNLVRVTFAFAILLILMGVGAYLATPEDSRSFTAFLPSIVGVLLLGAAYATTRPDIGRYGGIAAIILVLVLVIGSLRGVGNLFGALGDGGDVTLGMIVQVITVVLGVVYLIYAGNHIRGMIQKARERRQQAEA